MMPQETKISIFRYINIGSIFCPVRWTAAGRGWLPYAAETKIAVYGLSNPAAVQMKEDISPMSLAITSVGTIAVPIRKMTAF
jgi:hypothetical protein